MSKFIYPAYFQIVRHEATTWYFVLDDKVFYNPRSVSISLEPEEKLKRHGLAVQTVIVELFRINGGRAGYYLVNLRDKKYYYCGFDWADIKTKLLEIGIGRPDPMEQG